MFVKDASHTCTFLQIWPKILLTSGNSGYLFESLRGNDENRQLKTVSMIVTVMLILDLSIFKAKCSVEP